MAYFSWNAEKDQKLKRERGISFTDIVLRINAGHVLDVVEHPNQHRYPGQRILVVDVDGYAYMVPFVTDENGFFLKTIVPSRKYTRKYARGDQHEEQTR